MPARHILLPGLAAAALLSLGMYLSTLAGMQLDYTTGEIIGYSSMILALLLGQILSLRMMPAAAPGYGTRLLVAIAVTGITALLYGVFTWLLYAVIDPAFLPRFLAYYADHVRASGLPAEEIQAQLALLEQQKSFFLNPLMQALILAGTVLFIGLLLSLLTAWLVRPRIR